MRGVGVRSNIFAQTTHKKVMLLQS